MCKKRSSIIEIEQKYKNKVINNITILNFSQFKYKNNIYFFNCKCHCGNIFEVQFAHLKRGHTKSCGCYRKNYYENPSIRKKGNPLLNLLFNRYIRSSKKRNINFNLTLQEFEIIIKQNCFYCDLEPNMDLYKQRKDQIDKGAKWMLEYSYKHNGIDRKNNNLGYTVENCVSCCKYCNIGKNDLSYDTFLSKIKKIYEFKKLGI